MARFAPLMKGINPERYSTTYSDSSLADLQAWRDAWRAAFTAAAATHKASDIFRWGTAAARGRGFYVKDFDNGRSFLVLTGENESTTIAPDLDDYLGASGANLRAHVTRVGEPTVGTTAPGNGVVIIFNGDTATNGEPDLDFDDTANLTYTGGDDTDLVTINPDSLVGLAELRRSGMTFGVSFEESFTSATTTPIGSMCYDDERGMLFSAFTKQHLFCDRLIAVQGACGRPGAGGTGAQMTIKVETQTTLSNLSNPTHMKAYAFDGGGTERLYDLTPDEDLDDTTYKVASGVDAGKLDWKVVTVTNGSGGSGTYGTTHEEAVVEIGVFNDGRFHNRALQMLDADHPVVKLTDSCAFMWARDAVLPLTYGTGNP